jgi:hypothetical protein
MQKVDSLSIIMIAGRIWLWCQAWVECGMHLCFSFMACACLYLVSLLPIGGGDPLKEILLSLVCIL